MSLKKLFQRLELKNLLLRYKSRKLTTETIAVINEEDENLKNSLVVPKEDVERFISECMIKAGASVKDANVVGHHLMTADYRGHFSHGLNRLEMYVHDIATKLTDPHAQPKVVVDFQAVALVDGLNGLGQVVGNFCMDMAISKASKFGIGFVSARGSNHYGISGYYTLRAARENMIGFSCTNTSPLMVPTRSRKSALGTNPISIAMFGKSGDEFVLDMATTAVALGKIELAQRKCQDIPYGWATNKSGQITTDAHEAFESSMLMPLGGSEENSGYKGYGLGLMVELLCGVLSGSKYGPNIRSWKTGHEVANLGHCFMAINPKVFGDGTYERLDDLLSSMRALPKADEKSVMVAGDPERESMKKVNYQGGIKYHENQIANSEKFAKEMGVEPMRLVKMRS